MTFSEAMLRDLYARELIRDCLMRYARAIDRCDGEALAACYWPGAIDDHGMFSGNASNFVAWVIPLLKTMDQTSHFLGNMLIEIDGTKACVESYFEAYHRCRAEDGQRFDAILSGRYLDRFEERQGSWRIADRTVVYDWGRQFADSVDWSEPVLGASLRTNRHPTDPSYKLFDSR